MPEHEEQGKNLPPPLTPPSSDLTGLDYMPLHLKLLEESDFYALASDREFRIGLRLWGKAWHEKPAGSLPDNEVLLAKKAGVPLEEWRALAPMALHGWVKSNDGRLYHKPLARVVLKTWIDRIGHRRRSASGVAAREKRTFNGADFDAQKREAEAFLRALDPAAQTSGDDLGCEEVQPRVPDMPTPGAPQVAEIPTKGSGGKGREGKGLGTPTESKNNIFLISEGWTLDEAAIEDGIAVGLTKPELELAAEQHVAWWTANQPKARKTRDGWALAWRSRVDDLVDDPDKRAKLKRSTIAAAKPIEPPPLPDVGPAWWLAAAAKLRAAHPHRWTSYWSHCAPAEEQGFLVATSQTQADLMRNNGVIAEAKITLGFEIVVSAPPLRSVA